MKSTAKKLAVCAAALCLLACGTAVSAAAASPVSGLALSGVAMPWDQDVPAESIEAGSYTANMLLGSSQQLSPVVRPRNSTDSVVFISDDTSILTVSNSGVVQAVGVGTTRITAAAGNQICAYTIVVSMDSSMIVTEMDLSLSSNTIYVGNSVSAQLQVRPTSASNYATVTLTSSNEKVATVNNFGRVTGIAPGTATITATCGSVTATTNVTVMSIPNSGTGTTSAGSSNSGQVVTVNPSYVVLKPGATRTLTASVKPSSASQKFTYKSANSNIATVSPSGVITAVGTGATSITVSNGTASAMVTVIVNRSAASSSDNSSDSSSTEPDNDTPIEIDPVVQAIQDSEDNEIVFTQAEVPTVTGDILNALRTTGKTLCVVGDGYTMQTSYRKQNLSYWNKTAGNDTNISHLEKLEAIKAMNLEAPIVVVMSANRSGAMVWSEVEPLADVVFYRYGSVSDDAAVELIAGKVEPSALLCQQQPASMKAVEQEMEDVSRDLECYVDANGNTYDFAYGLNWSGVINDERVATYSAAPLTHVENMQFHYAQ